MTPFPRAQKTMQRVAPGEVARLLLAALGERGGGRSHLVSRPLAGRPAGDEAIAVKSCRLDDALAAVHLGGRYHGAVLSGGLDGRQPPREDTRG